MGIDKDEFMAVAPDHPSSRIEARPDGSPVYARLPKKTNARGFDVYCHVCWEEVYLLWVERTPPNYNACPLGDYTAVNCPNSIAGANRARLAALADERALVLWREREAGFPAHTRRMNPDAIDRASGAWAVIRKRAFLDVLGTLSAGALGRHDGSQPSNGMNPKAPSP